MKTLYRPWRRETKLEIAPLFKNEKNFFQTKVSRSFRPRFVTKFDSRKVGNKERAHSKLVNPAEESLTFLSPDTGNWITFSRGKGKKNTKGTSLSRARAHLVMSNEILNRSKLVFGSLYIKCKISLSRLRQWRRRRARCGGGGGVAGLDLCSAAASSLAEKIYWLQLRGGWRVWRVTRRF